MLTEIETLDVDCRTYYLPTEAEEPVWVTDSEGELVLFAMVQDGQVTEWVWL